jgi:hypothetical protein
MSKVVKRILRNLPEHVLRDEAEMRAFYASCGISQRTIEAAIRMRQARPVDEEKKASSIRRGRPKRAF